jgi:hypothetical protein
MPDGGSIDARDNPPFSSATGGNINANVQPRKNGMNALRVACPRDFLLSIAGDFGNMPARAAGT